MLLVGSMIILCLANPLGTIDYASSSSYSIDLLGLSNQLLRLIGSSVSSSCTTYALLLNSMASGIVFHGSGFFLCRQLNIGGHCFGKHNNVFEIRKFRSISTERWSAESNLVKGLILRL